MSGAAAVPPPAETVAVVKHVDVEETLQPIRESSRTTAIGGQFWIWAGANIAPINWVLGALGIHMGLGLWDTFGVLAAGNILGMSIFGLFVLLGQRTGVTGMVLGRGVFGRRGNYLPATIHAVVVIGWWRIALGPAVMPRAPRPSTPVGIGPQPGRGHGVDRVRRVIHAPL